MKLNKNNINNLFYIFLMCHLVLWTLIPTLTNYNLPLDTIEALAWGSNLDWGFSKHPAASAFFLEITYQIFGSKDWAYYLLSQLFVITSFIVVFKFAEEIFKKKILSLISVILLEGIFFYNFTTPEFNVNVCQLPFWSLCVLYSWKIFNKNNIDFKDVFLLGVFAAIGFLSKYLFVYLLLSIFLFFIFLIFIKKNKKFDFKYLISLEVFIVLLIPHIIWLINNDYITVTYGLARVGLENYNLLNHVIFPLTFLGKQIGILFPLFLMSFFLIKKFKLRLSPKDKKLLFLIVINLIPIILIFLTSMITGSKIRTMWMTPFYLFSGVFVVYVFQAGINLKKLNSFILIFLTLFLISPFAYAYISIIETNKRTDYPGNKIANKVEFIWKKKYKEPINIVLGDEWHAGNLSYHLKSRPIWGGAITVKNVTSLSKYMCIDDMNWEEKNLFIACVGVK